MIEDSLVHSWLGVLKKFPQSQVPFYPRDFERMQEHAGVAHTRVILDNNGNPSIYFVDREKTINRLKNHFNFKTKEEVKKHLLESAKEMQWS